MYFDMNTLNRRFIPGPVVHEVYLYAIIVDALGA